MSKLTLLLGIIEPRALGECNKLMAHVDKDGIITYCYAVRGRPQFFEQIALCCPEKGTKWRKDWDQCVIKEGRQKLAELDGVFVLLNDIMQKKGALSLKFKNFPDRIRILIQIFCVKGNPNPV